VANRNGASCRSRWSTSSPATRGPLRLGASRRPVRRDAHQIGSRAECGVVSQAVEAAGERAPAGGYFHDLASRCVSWWRPQSSLRSPCCARARDRSQHRHLSLVNSLSAAHAAVKIHNSWRFSPTDSSGGPTTRGPIRSGRSRERLNRSIPPSMGHQALHRHNGASPSSSTASGPRGDVRHARLPRCSGGRCGAGRCAWGDRCPLAVIRYGFGQRRFRRAAGAVGDA